MKNYRNEKTGLLTQYAHACGYIETAKNTNHTITVELYLDGTWHVRSFNNKESVRLTWECFDSYNEALNYYYETCAAHEAGIYCTQNIEETWNDKIHGSGFNYDIDITVYEKQNTVHVNTFYQCMNEHGYYVGSIPVKVVYRYNHGAHKLECKNVIYRKNYQGCYIGEYIEDTIYMHMDTLHNYTWSPFK